MEKKENLLEPHEQFPVDKDFHSENRKRVIKAFNDAHPDLSKNSIIFLKGDITHHLHDSDVDHFPRQEANFWYLFGVDDPDCYGILHLETGKSYLIVPKIPGEYKIWMVVHDKEYFKENNLAEETHYCEELEDLMKQLAPSNIFLNYGKNSDSGLYPDIPSFDWLKNYKVDKEKLYDLLAEVRVFKSQKEIEMLKYAGKISSEAHIRCMMNAKAGLKEYQIEALYRFHCLDHTGSRFLAYESIVGSGRNAATLHYIVNDKTIEDGALVLSDQGFQFYGYISDITCTFPINGKFTKKQAEIYNAVLDANKQVFNAAKPGVKWEDMHILAERTIVTHLIKLGIIKDTDLDELQKHRVGAVFFPHGLGHLIGLNVHDCGGYSGGCPQRATEFGLKSLRTRRTLQPGMCLTIEPGLYFVDYCEEKFKNDPNVGKYINWDKFEEYKEVGGVRIEDDVYVTETGMAMLNDVPRTVEEIEACMAGKDWKNL
jgi:Xaa-Pro dipeptidase